MNERLRSRSVYRGRIINLRLDEVRLPDGAVVTREVVEHPGAAAVVPVDAEGNVHLVRQYRDAAARRMLEIPAGKLKQGEDPAECARRELAEELGLMPGRLTALATFYSSPGFCDELMHLFLAEDLEPVTAACDHDEFLEPETRRLEDVDRLLAELEDAKSIAGILLALKHLQERRQGGAT